jgi:hypothetical protein
VWIRTQANAPAQRPWFSETGGEGSGQLASGRVAANQMKTLPYMWRWSEFSPYLHRISEIARKAEVSPIEFADRQSILLLNPGLNGRLQVTNTIRCAISIYNPGDVAPVHLHSPNASRTILSNKGGYTVVEGERCTAERGDLILTPNGTWHDHGNDSGEPVIWIDMLDWPLMEFLDAAWVDHDMPGAQGNAKAADVLMDWRVERIVLLGKNVARCFGFRDVPFLAEIRIYGRRFLIFPHPSGTNRWWNERQNERRARQLLQRFLRGETVSTGFRKSGRSTRTRSG